MTDKSLDKIKARLDAVDTCPWCEIQGRLAIPQETTGFWKIGKRKAGEITERHNKTVATLQAVLSDADTLWLEVMELRKAAENGENEHA